MNSLPPPPALIPMAQVLCDVGTLVTLGPGKYGERRYVPLGGGTVQHAAGQISLIYFAYMF